MNIDEQDNRQHQRVDSYNHALISYHGMFIPGIALNLSPVGMLVDLQTPPRALPIDLQVYLTCGNNNTLCLPAQVAHITGSRVGLLLDADEAVDLYLCASGGQQ